MKLIEQVQGTNKIRFSLDTGAIVFRHPEHGNLHSRFGGETENDTLFEVIPREDGIADSFYMKANNGLYVSAFDSHGLHLRASKADPDRHCVFLIRDPNHSKSADDL